MPPYAPYPDPLDAIERQIGVPLNRPSRGRQKRDLYEPLVSEAEQQSLLQMAGGTAMGGLSIFSSALDLPGSMARDVLSWGGRNPQNPFDQLLTPFSPANRIDGRELLRGYDLVGNKDTWGNWGAGLAAEIILDPTTYLTLGGSALLTGAGKTAKATGGLAKGIGGQVAAGQRGIAALNLPFGIGGKSIPLGAGTKWGERAGNALDYLGDKIAFGNIPGTKISPGRGWNALMDPRARGVTDEATQRMAFAGNDKIDMARGSVNQGMARTAHALQDATLDYTDPAVSSMTRDVFEKRWAASDPTFVQRQADAAAAGKNPADVFPELLRTDAGDIRTVAEDIAAGRHLNGTMRPLASQTGEFAEGASMPTAKWVKDNFDALIDSKAMEEVQGIKAMSEMNLAAGRNLGIGKHALQDPFIEHLSRKRSNIKQGMFEQPTGGRQAQEFGSLRAEDLGREEIFRGWASGTKGIQEVSSDPRVNDMIENALDRGTQPEEIALAMKRLFPNQIADIGDALRDAAGNVVKPDYFEMYVADRDAFKQLPDDLKKVLEPRIEKLVKVARYLMETPKPLRDAGIFANSPFFDAKTMLRNQHDQVAVTENVLDFLGSDAVELDLRGIPSTTTTSINEVLDKLGLTEKLPNGKHVALAHIAQKRNLNLDDVTGNARIPDDIAKSITRYHEGFRNPEVVNLMIKALDSYTSFFKGSVTNAWPAYHVRNMLSGQMQNIVAQQFSGRSVGDANRLLHGQYIEDAAQIPVVKRLLALQGRAGTSKEATRLIRELSAAWELLPKYEGLAADLPGGIGSTRPGTTMDVISEVPGAVPFNFHNVADEFRGKSPGTTYDLRKASLRGVAGSEETTFAYMKGMESIGHYTEGINRLSPFIHKLRRIKDVDNLTGPQINKLVKEAADEVGASQVQYGSRHFAPFEKDVLKRLIPFYSFTSRMLPWTLRELVKHPGGRLAQTIRATSTAKDPTKPMPDYVSETAAIPVAGGPLEALLGTPKDGGDRFITGLGMMHEDPLSFFGTGIGGAGIETLSRLNPLLKAPLQWATNQSFFQKGPVGGRPLEDLDPTIGRLLANITNQKNAVTYPGDRQVEAILETLPISRALTTARQLTDTRKGIASKAINTLTGIRVADVSPATSDSVLRERMQRLEKTNFGGRTFEIMYTPDWVKERMSPKQLEALAKIEAMKRELVRRRQVRKAEDEAAVSKAR